MITRIHAPFAGIVRSIDQVPDPVFALKLVGDGIAIDPLSAQVLAPFDGRVIAIAPTGHSITLESNDGLELLIHVGIDTVALAGRGFTTHVATNDLVAAGEMLIDLDLDFIATNAPSLVTPIIITAPDAHIRFRAKSGPIAASELLLEVERQNHPVAPKAEGTQSTAHVMATLPDGHGIHARPAARISALARKFDGAVEIRCGSRKADAKSVTSLLMLGAVAGDQIDIRVIGVDPRGFAVQLAELIAGQEVEDGDFVADAPVDDDFVNGPIAPDQIRAVRASPGIAVGPVLHYGDDDVPIALETGEPAVEHHALSVAKEAVKGRLATQATDPAVGEAAAAIALAHIALIDDIELNDRVAGQINDGASAARAWRTASRQQEDALRGTGVARLSERAIDLRDIERQMIAELIGTNTTAPKAVPKGAIIIAEDLPPSFLIEPAHRDIGGIILTAGGATSHIAILAAARAIPMLVAAGEPAKSLVDSSNIILDADRRLIESAPDEQRIAAVRTQLTERAVDQAKALARSAQDCTMADGQRIEIFANLASADDARHAMTMGAEGCGLLRTEFIFAECDTPPSEDWQTDVYADIASAMEGRPLIIRTLDAGGDKPLRCLPFEAEENPALGMRGIRFSMQRTDILKTQLRAMLRGVPVGQLRIMLPMIVDPGEYRLVRTLLDEARADLGIDDPIELGVMIETPAAAMLADTIAADADFLSIGSNDLAQYVLAMDRGNAALSARVDALHPAVLRMIATAADGARRYGRWFGICGGIASEPKATALLIGLGCRELSSVASQIPQIKDEVRRLDLAACQHLARRACALDSAEAVRALIEGESP